MADQEKSESSNFSLIRLKSNRPETPRDEASPSQGPPICEILRPSFQIEIGNDSENDEEKDAEGKAKKVGKKQ